MEEIKNHLSEDTVKKVMEKFDDITKTLFSAIFPVAVSSALLLSFAIYSGLQNDSFLFGLLLFICLVPLFVLGVGTLSIGNALSRLIDSINFLFQTTAHIALAIYQDNKEKGAVRPKALFLTPTTTFWCRP